MYIVLITLWIVDTFLPDDNDDNEPEQTEARRPPRAEYTNRPSLNRTAPKANANVSPKTSDRTNSHPTHSGSNTSLHDMPKINKSRAIVIERAYTEEI